MVAEGDQTIGADRPIRLEQHGHLARGSVWHSVGIDIVGEIDAVVAAGDDQLELREIRHAWIGFIRDVIRGNGKPSLLHPRWVANLVGALPILTGDVIAIARIAGVCISRTEFDRLTLERITKHLCFDRDRGALVGDPSRRLQAQEATEVGLVQVRTEAEAEVGLPSTTFGGVFRRPLYADEV